MFRDECEILVQAGKGGDGLVSFHREKYVPKGGPDGGDGGAGGDVILVATSRVSSLLSIARRPLYKAHDGRPGGPNKRYGASAEAIRLEVPIGTQIYDKQRGHLLRDLSTDGDEVVLARGGRGGRGNTSFANSVRQTPRTAERGTEGERRAVCLELKLFAEVGLLGLPNAGKSTFLSVVSRATPKVADYPFTTLIPQVGVAAVGDYDTLVIADLPGLIEGAAEGAGLGHRFLKHVERCRVLLQLIDVSAGATTDPREALEVLDSELLQYSPELHRRPRLLVASKCETDEDEERAATLEAAVGKRFLRLSSVQGKGIVELLEAARGLVRELEAQGTL